MSSFNFQIEHISVAPLTHGVRYWDTAQFLANHPDFTPKSEATRRAILERLKEEGNTAFTPNYGTKDRVTITGVLNDGTSISIHVDNFDSWLVYQFDDHDNMGEKDTKETVEAAISSSYNSRLQNMEVKVLAREDADGFRPARDNPYEPRKDWFVFIYNKDDQSSAAEKALTRAMETVKARLIENSAMTKEIRFMMLTNFTPNGWYTLLHWKEPDTFCTTTQLEITADYNDIIPMHKTPNGVPLAPHTFMSFDIEQTKDPSVLNDEGKERAGLPDAHEPKDNIICISAIVFRHGNFGDFLPDDPCVQRIPRLEDDDATWRSTFTSPNAIIVDRNEAPINLPDPLDILESKMLAANMTVSAPESRYEVHEKSINAYLGVEQENKEATTTTNEVFDENDQTHDHDDPQHMQWALSAANGMIVDINASERDESIEHDIARATSDMQKLFVSTTKKRLERSDHEKSPSQPTSNQMDATPMQPPNPEPYVPVSETVQEESQSSKDARHGFEIPTWATDKLKARMNILDENAKKDAKARVQTPFILKNLKYIRRLQFYVMPELPVPFRAFHIPALYDDESEGIFVYAYQREGDALLAFRDFMVYTHPDVICGHYSKGYDELVINIRANLSLGDKIPLQNKTRDMPMTKIGRYLPVVENNNIASTFDNCMDVTKAEQCYGMAANIDYNTKKVKSNNMRQAAEQQKLELWVEDAVERGKALLDPNDRKSLFSFMDRFIFKPVHLKRTVTQSNNTGVNETICFAFSSTIGDIDSLVATRLNRSNYDSYSLQFLSKELLNDSKLDITINRMDEAYRQHQHWGVSVYCDNDAVLVIALLYAQNIHASHATLGLCSSMSRADIVNYGQQRRFYTRSAILAHNSDMVLTKSRQTAPANFRGGFVVKPHGANIRIALLILDFVSYYVTTMIQLNLCFSTFMCMFDDNFNIFRLLPDGKNMIDLLRKHREFEGRLRLVYGPPKRRIRPANKPFYQCQRCDAENFELVPFDMTLEECPTHEKLPQHPRAVELVAQLPSDCPYCSTKPWFLALPETVDNSKLPDLTDPRDPYREDRYAKEYDFIKPRGSGATLKGDAEAEYMGRVKRYKPLGPNDMDTGSKEFVTEDILTEYDEFHWKDAQTWAKERWQMCGPKFREACQTHKEKAPKAPKDSAKVKQKGKRKEPKKPYVPPVTPPLERFKYDKTDPENVPYYPGTAHFIDWNEGEHDNQMHETWRQNEQKRLSTPFSAHRISHQVPEDEAEEEMLKHTKTLRKHRWANVYEWATYADGTARYADRKHQEAFMLRKWFRRALYDIRVRRGIRRIGSTTRDLRTLFGQRVETKAQMEALQKDPTIWDDAKKIFLSLIAQLQYSGLNSKQLAEKTGANSKFGANAATTGAVGNANSGGNTPGFDRNFTHYVNEIIRRDWCPSEELYQQICEFRRESIKFAFQYGESGKTYFKRYVRDAPWPLQADAGRQFWLKPAHGVNDFIGDHLDSLWSIFIAYGDTDSTFPSAPFVLPGPDSPNFTMDEKRRKLLIAIGKEQAEYVTLRFRQYGLEWMTLDFEKMGLNTSLFEALAKRYFLEYWTKPAKYDKILPRGFGVKRDAPLFQKKIIQVLQKKLLETDSEEEFMKTLQEQIDAMLKSNTGIIEDIEKDVLPFVLSKAWNKPKYENAEQHIEANNRFAKDFEGYEHSLGERIPFVICYKPERGFEKVCSRTYCVNHIRHLLERRKKIAEQVEFEKRHNIQPSPAALKEREEKLAATYLRIDLPKYMERLINTVGSFFSIVKTPIKMWEYPSMHLYDDAPWKKLDGVKETILPPRCGAHALLASAGLTMADLPLDVDMSLYETSEPLPPKIRRCEHIDGKLPTKASDSRSARIRIIGEAFELDDEEIEDAVNESILATGSKRKGGVLPILEKMAKDYLTPYVEHARCLLEGQPRITSIFPKAV